MTDKEKLIKIKSLADKMHDTAFNMTTNAGLLRKAMDDYHQFIINEYHKEEPVSEEWIEELRTKLNSMSKEDFKKVFDKYAVDFNEEPVSEDLIDVAKQYVKEHVIGIDKVTFSIATDMFISGAKWGKNQAMAEIQAQSMALPHGCPKEEPVSEDLEEAAHKYADGENPTCPCEECLIRTFKVGAKWKKAHNWKSADGDDLPEIDREVIAFQETFPTDVDVPSLLKIVIAHRPNPEGYDGKSITTGQVEHYTPKTYDKGGWNIPNVKYWLDCSMPKEIEL